MPAGDRSLVEITARHQNDIKCSNSESYVAYNQSIWLLLTHHGLGWRKRHQSVWKNGWQRGWHCGVHIIRLQIEDSRLTDTATDACSCPTLSAQLKLIVGQAGLSELSITRIKDCTRFAIRHPLRWQPLPASLNVCKRDTQWMYIVDYKAGIWD